MSRKRLIDIFIASLAFALIFANPAAAKEKAPAKNAGVVFWHGDTHSRQVALTFDDGPNDEYTPRILDILKQYDVKATFFLIGKNVERAPMVARRIAAEGHCIGNHSFDHPDFLFENNLLMDRELLKAEEAILRAAGVRPRLFRPPYGDEDRRILAEAERLGYVIVEWSVSAGNGWTEIGAQQIINNVVQQVRNGSIILLHDGNRLAKDPHRVQVIQALPVIIEQLRKKGYSFVTVPELLGFKDD